jgi:hypothetical protein
VGAALADDTEAVLDGVVVGADSVGAGSDAWACWGGEACWGGDAGLALGPTVSPPVVVINTVLTTVRCSGVGCGAGSGSALGGTESARGGGSFSTGDVSTAGMLLTIGDVVTIGDVGAGASSVTCFPLTIIVLSTVGCCVEEGCSFAQASLELRTKAKRHKTSATSRARGFRLRG